MGAVEVRRSRATWGARPPAGLFGRYEPTALKGLAVHHSGSPEDREQHHERCAQRVQAIQRFHQQDQGWTDIAYHWVACNHGVLFEGRPVWARSAAQGTDEGNAHYLAVCYLGDGAHAVLDAWGGALRHALLVARDEVLRVNASAVQVWPHLRFHATSCPGSVLRDWCRQFP